MTRQAALVERVHRLILQPRCPGRCPKYLKRYISSEQARVVGTIPQGGHGIKESQYAEVMRSFTREDVAEYAALIGDHNPIHIHDGGLNDGTVVVHGMLVASLFSSIFGTLISGSLYRSQSLNFRLPVYSDEIVKGRVDVTRVQPMRRRGLLVTCDTVVLRKSEQVT
uniref:MaoC-like domain-containing protein n=1 Tax=Attheya septentrionalis TaxID=420275 RepID=A0A7S2UDE0_9STRA|mmetsp:Transcript_21202/g.38265  ORF Transcript_21202/g.38265 Transcript_21202/m.38265 type:complete len:167 (+) Transcript_21202:321-821(+)